jgi:putative copper resistance protein D
MTMTEGLLVAVRAIHYAATLALFGEIVFALLASSHARSGESWQTEQGRFSRSTIAAWLVAVVSGVCWLLLVATLMSERALGEGYDIAVVKTVVQSTVFGRAWSVRALLALALAALWLVARTGRASHHLVVGALVTVLAGAFVVGLAWAGHANIEVGRDGVIHHLGDAIHLLAAGAWLGGLAPLVASLRRLEDLPSEDALESGARAVARFGTLATACVGLLLATGVINARYTLRTPMALLDTVYGHLLLLKLVLFLLMLATATVNRVRLTPALMQGNDLASRSTAARRLRRNTCAEQALGLGILALVGAIGISSPPMGT